MARMCWLLSVAVLGLAGLLVGCSGETAAPVDTSLDDNVHTVAPSWLKA